MSKLAEKIRTLIHEVGGNPSIAEIDALLVDNLHPAVLSTSPLYQVTVGSEGDMSIEEIEQSLERLRPPVEKLDLTQADLGEVELRAASHIAGIEEVKPITRIRTFLERERKRVYHDMNERLHVDSLTLIRLVAFIEDELHIRIEDEELQAENFYTLNDIQKLLTAKTVKEDCWIPVSKGLPADGQRVIARYTGVYDNREVTFWRDRDGKGNPHFGSPNEKDGKGSQPATHWKPL